MGSAPLASVGSAGSDYDALAEFWPLISPPEDYQAEAESVRRTVLEELIRAGWSEDRPRVLELGSGAGHSLCHYRNAFDLTALDGSAAMLELSRALNPTVEHIQGDMRDLAGCLGSSRRFEAVLLHDAADYLTSPEEVSATLRGVSRCLMPGGVLFLAPTYTWEDFVEHERSWDARSDGISRAKWLSYVDGLEHGERGVGCYRFGLWMAIEADGELRLLEQIHRCGLFSRAYWQDILKACGFAEPRVDDFACESNEASDFSGIPFVTRALGSDAKPA